MKLKLDENLGSGCAALCRHAGHDAHSVPDERLEGILDQNLIAVCQREERCLLTLDLDFSNPLLFKPSLYAGIAVLRLPGPPSRFLLHEAVRTFLLALEKESIVGRLWIVEIGRIRVYQEEAEKD